MKKNLTSWLFSFVIQAKQYGSSTALDFTKQNFSVECHILFYRQCFVKLSCILLLHWFLLMEKVGALIIFCYWKYSFYKIYQIICTYLSSSIFKGLYSNASNKQNFLFCPWCTRENHLFTRYKLMMGQGKRVAVTNK